MKIKLDLRKTKIAIISWLITFWEKLSEWRGRSIKRDSNKKILRKIEKCEIKNQKEMIRIQKCKLNNDSYIDNYHCVLKQKYDIQVNKVNMFYQEVSILLNLYIGLLAVSITVLIALNNSVIFGVGISLKTIIMFLSGSVIGILLISYIMLIDSPLQNRAEGFLYTYPIEESVWEYIGLIYRIERRYNHLVKTLYFARYYLIAALFYIAFGCYTIFTGDTASIDAIQRNIFGVFATMLGLLFVVVPILEIRERKKLIKQLDKLEELYLKVREIETEYVANIDFDEKILGF